MRTQSKIFKSAIVVAVFVVLVVVWAVNGYDDTWLYITAGIVAVPASYFL